MVWIEHRKSNKSYSRHMQFSLHRQKNDVEKWEFFEISSPIDAFLRIINLISFSWLILLPVEFMYNEIAFGIDLNRIWDSVIIRESVTFASTEKTSNQLNSRESYLFYFVKKVTNLFNMSVWTYCWKIQNNFRI